MLRRHLSLAGILTALLVLAAASCAQEAGSGLASADDDPSSVTTDADEPGGGGEDTIGWEDCGSADCGTLEVPVDYDDPAGDTLTLSLARVPAGSEDDRIGALFVNPGGPGGTASDFAISMAAVLPAALTDRFDIVGVDPRGLGASEISCEGDVHDLYGVDYSVDSPDDTAAVLAVNQDYVDGCEQNVGDLLSHLGTADVARDFDAVRAAMGDDQLNYLGFSYGTAIGQQLVELFPERVRAMIIDGVVELGPTGIESAVGQAAGFETALRSFADDCNADDSCPIGPDAIGAIEELQARAEAAPIPADPRDLGPAEMSSGLTLPLYSESLWPDLADAVAEGLAGDGTGMVELADDYLSIADFDVYYAVNCLDWEWPEDPQELLDAGVAAASESPHFGASVVNEYVSCAMWPVEDRPMGVVTAPDAPPILVVSTTNDPATPYEAGVRTAERLASGVLLTYEGDGHTVVGNGVPCVDDIAVAYLVDLEVPEDGTTC